MQKWLAMGRLAKDIEIRYSNDGKAVARFDFAVNRRFKREGEADADFFSCVAFGKLAETLERCNVGKGTKLLIEGEMRNNNYEKDGVKYYGMQLYVNGFEFGESKTSSNGSEAASSSTAGFTPMQNTDDDLPF